MAAIRSFRDLQVYQKAVEASKQIYVRTHAFPRDELYSMTNQVRRSSRAVGAMIAEAWARRRYPAAFVSKIDEALGEAMETQAWLDQALSCEFIAKDEHRAMDAIWQQIGAMLMRMIDRAESFCRNSSRKQD